ncbi:kz, partial [Symbiodinium sp. CCMP2456]
STQHMCPRTDESQLPAPPLKLVIMSATLRLCDFTENQQLFPVPPPVLRIDARTFPVTVHFARRTDDDYIKAAYRSVLQIHKDLPPGSILVFVTGRQEVHRLCRMLQQWQMRASKHGDGAEGEAEEEAEEKERPLELEASDDEGNAESDAEPGELQKPPEEPRDSMQGDGSKAADAKLARSPKKAKGKKRKAPESLPKDSARDAEQGGALTAKKRRRKAKKITEAVGDANSKEEGQGGQGQGEETEAAQEEMPELSFALGEEDTVLLEAEAQAEDAKDRELRNQRKVRMTRLDKSRTAGGVFKGAGFGEGPLRVLPLYAQLSATRQLAPFAEPPEGERVVVIATNVAETSVTLPNVRYVVDTGKEKRRRYKAASGVSAFVIDRISKASADQRAGRAGRLGPGHTYRLYSSAAYENYFTKFASGPLPWVTFSRSLRSLLLSAQQPMAALEGSGYGMYLTNFVLLVQDASDSATWPGTVTILLALAFLAAGEEAHEAQTLGAPCRSLIQVNHTAAKAKVPLKAGDPTRSDKQNGGRSSTKPENSVRELLEEGSLFVRHVAISLIGVAPEEVATSMPYLVMFGILLAVLSFCALSRQTEDGAFLTSSLAHLRASSTADTASDELKAARRAARAGPRPARTGPPDLRPQAQSFQSSQTGQSPLISLCPELVVPEKVECTLLVPLVRGHAAKRASTLPVSDVKGETIFLLETIPDGRSSDGTRLILSSPMKDVRFCTCRTVATGFVFVNDKVYGGRFANLKKLDSGFTLTADSRPPFRFQGSLSTSIDATDDDGRVLAYSGVAEADSHGIPQLKLNVGPGVDAGLMVVCYAALELLHGASQS